MSLAISGTCIGNICKITPNSIQQYPELRIPDQVMTEVNINCMKT